jgi:ATP-dependent RNA helicase DDX54/DBP10
MDASGKKVKMGSFQSMGLEENILKGLLHMGYKVPTPVQRKALPAVLSGLDIVCMARTGSGKTCVFLLPMIQKLKSHQSSGVRGVVLAPTRELAQQTYKFAKDMAKYTDLRIISILGGDAMDPQFDALSSKPDIIVATPGRLIHHLHEIKTFKLKGVRYLVFDEADRLFEMGFADQLNEIIRECPLDRQTLLFSATMPKMIVQFSRAGLKDPQLIRLDTDVKMSDELRMAFFMLRSTEKLAALLYLARNIIPANQQTIIFAATRYHTELIHSLFQKVGLSSMVVYGTMDQDARTNNLKAFRQGEISFLIVTDVAARGIDVPLLNNVINYHFPPTPKLFVHRCGRAARQGRIGYAFSFVEPDEMAYMMDVHRFLDKKLHTGCPESTEDAVPTAEVDGDGDGDEDDEEAAASDVDSADEEAKLKRRDAKSWAKHVVVAKKGSQPVPYTLDQMDPTMVHTGLLPQDVLDRDSETVKRLLDNDDEFMALFRVTENAVKQYRRNRPEANHDGVKAAKKVVKYELVKTLHPLIMGCDPQRCSADVLAKQEYIRMLQTFRPQQTVFETGIGTGCLPLSSSAAKIGGTTANAAALVAQGRGRHAEAADAMRSFRQASSWHLERNRVKNNAALQKMGSTVLASVSAEAAERAADDDDDDDGEADDAVGDDDDDEGQWASDDEGDEDDEDEDDVDDSDGDADSDDGEVAPSGRRGRVGGALRQRPQSSNSVVSWAESAAYMAPSQMKKRLSVAERRRMKKLGVQISYNAMDDEDAAAGVAPKKRKASGGDFLTDQAAGFQDPRFYMAYGTEDTSATYTEEAMQPMANLRSSETFSATRADMQHAIDFNSEDADAARKKKLTRWDAKKRKFVKVSAWTSAVSSRLRMSVLTCRWCVVVANAGGDGAGAQVGLEAAAVGGGCDEHVDLVEGIGRTVRRVEEEAQARDQRRRGGRRGLAPPPQHAREHGREGRDPSSRSDQEARREARGLEAEEHREGQAAADRGLHASPEEGPAASSRAGRRRRTRRRRTRRRRTRRRRTRRRRTRRRRRWQGQAIAICANRRLPTVHGD